MGFYRDWILPPVIDLAMRNLHLRPYRERVARAAEGRVLEIGIGSGLNLALYGPQVREVLGLDPSSALLGRARTNANALRDRLRLFNASAEAIPLADRSIDTAVMTWVGCSIPDAPAALGEVRRVLRPGGRLLFVEHGRAPDPVVARWQDRITPAWRLVTGGCRLNRQIDRIIADAGFRLDRLQTGYIPGPRVMTFLYEGAAVPR